MVVITHNSSKCWTSFSFGTVGRNASDQLTCWQALKLLLSCFDCFLFVCTVTFSLFYLGKSKNRMPRPGKPKHFLHEEGPILSCNRKIHCDTPKVVGKDKRLLDRQLLWPPTDDKRTMIHNNGTTRVGRCGKGFKHGRGLKILQSRVKRKRRDRSGVQTQELESPGMQQRHRQCPT